jgi:hypothetical protein
MKLLSQSAFAREIGCSQQAISKACREGGPLFAALYENRIDVESEEAIEYKDQKKLKKNIKKKLKPKKKQKKVQVIEKADDDEYMIDDLETGRRDLIEFGEMKINWLVARFGTAPECLTWVKAMHEMEKVRERRIKNDQKTRQLVSRELIKMGLIDPIEETWTRMLTDGSKTEAIQAYAMAKSGRTVDDIEKFIRENKSRFIRVAKERIVKIIERIEVNSGSF